VSCVDDPQYFDKCFIFFPSAELLNTASRCHSSSPDPTPLAAYGASILASSALDLRSPNVPLALTTMNVVDRSRNAEARKIVQKMHSEQPVVTKQGKPASSQRVE